MIKVQIQHPGVIGCAVFCPIERGEPGPSPDPRYVALASRAAAANLPLVVWINSNEMTVPVNTILDEIDTYYTSYPSLSGIYLEIVDMSCDFIPPYYQVIWDHVHKIRSNPMVIFNMGPLATECHMNVSTMIVTYEGEFADYVSYVAPAWTKKYDPHRFWHTVFDVPALALPYVYQRSVAQGAGHVYISNEDIVDVYNSLPSYFDKLVSLAVDD
eukprot:TRINITY_DN5771_c0_g1_i1.p1 TRINITY_DN5771_c0_g1~~TRINITY_DN5771_c0_g1_i1.p1  ORF type:complete len:214 (-),score=42.93 TRINITY_DN5771_c0_g1_i1:138-779(-)